MFESVLQMVKVDIDHGMVFLIVFLVFVTLKIIETGLNIVYMVKGKKEKIVKEIKTIEEKQIKPLIKEFRADSLLEKMLKEGKVRLVCPVHGCDVQVLIDGSIYCPECEKQYKK